jgi:phosphatidylglycerol:prolipoprotein diacylglycerol transferase
MHPILIKFGVFNVYSFGFMLAASFLVGIYISARRAKKFGVDPQYVLDLSVYLILAGVIGSRLLYVVFHLTEYDNILDIFALWQGGATLYGGFLLAVLVSYIFAHTKGIDYLLITDIMSPALALGIMLTRVGCYMSGCCFGKETSLPWGVIFPPESAAGAYARQLTDNQGAVPLHPSQLYAVLFGMITFLVLILAERKLSKRGSTFGAFLVLYGVFRFALDFTRYYEANMIVFLGLTLNQLISIAIFVVGLFLLLRKTQLETVAK